MQNLSLESSSSYQQLRIIKCYKLLLCLNTTYNDAYSIITPAACFFLTLLNIASNFLLIRNGATYPFQFVLIVIGGSLCIPYSADTWCKYAGNISLISDNLKSDLHKTTSKELKKLSGALPILSANIGMYVKVTRNSIILYNSKAISTTIQALLLY